MQNVNTNWYLKFQIDFGMKDIEVNFFFFSKEVKKIQNFQGQSRVKWLGSKRSELLAIGMWLVYIIQENMQSICD